MPEIRRILCPVDFSDASQHAVDHAVVLAGWYEASITALQFAFSLAQEGDAGLTILHVLEWPPVDELLDQRSFSAPEYRRHHEEAATERLEALVPVGIRDWCKPSTRLGHGKPYREILGIATEEGVDLIVMGVHGRNALDLMLFGSTTNQVVRRATCPVLTLRH